MRQSDGITNLVEMSLSKLREIVKGEAWNAAVHGSQKVRHDLVTEQQPTLTLLTNHMVHVLLQGLRCL